MPPEHDDLAYLSDMLAAARAVQSFVKDETFESYLSNLMLRSAVERQVEIIGEARRRGAYHASFAMPTKGFRGSALSRSGTSWPMNMV